MALPESHSTKPRPKPDIAFVEACRACSSGYDFKLDDDVIVTVICGIPLPSSEYKAVSYLWEMGDGVKVRLICRGCKKEKVVPVRNAGKLWRIMKFVSGSENSCKIWLDALSIDQDNLADLQAQLEVMGNIYRDAEIVSVLLPLGDEVAYSMLRKLSVVSQAVVNYERSGKPNVWGLDESDTELAELMESFLETTKAWTANLYRWRYWSRAWTFQEWAMARELEITCEIDSHKEILRDIKNIIVMAASIVGLWKNSQVRLSGLAAGTLPDILRVREETGAFLNEVRLHFPLADFLVADNELEGEDLRTYTFITSSSAIDSGTYVTPQSPASKELSVQKMLSLSLNALTTSRRHAGYKADLVACWASMCNIKYVYKNSDTVDNALHKVLVSLRRSGLRIYNFQVNTTGGECDLRFMKYAAAMRQSNSQSKGFMFGSPAFTGRADTVTHLRMSLEESGELLDFDKSFNVKLRKISNATVTKIQLLLAREEVISTFKEVVCGTADGKKICDVVTFFQEMLDQARTKTLQHRVLATVSIEVHSDATIDSFNAWAIFPASLATLELFVARESMNGTLVIATSEYPSSPETTSTQIVGYLNMTHQKDGTYLIRTNEEGVVDIVFRAPEKPLFDEQWLVDLTAGMGGDFLDLGLGESLNDRAFNVKIKLHSRKIAVRLKSPLFLAELLNWLDEVVGIFYDVIVLWFMWLFEMIKTRSQAVKTGGKLKRHGKKQKKKS